MTAYKKGGKTCSQGWTQSISAYWGLSSKRKVAMAAMDEGNGNIAGTDFTILRESVTASAPRPASSWPHVWAS